MELRRAEDWPQRNDSAVADRSMPEVDWLTGLASRQAFSRQVTQAERDRDRLSVATIAIGDFAKLNRQLDYDAGDDLLRQIGQTLEQHTGVNSLAGRLGGAEFGIAAVEVPEGELMQWLEPIVAAVRRIIASWTRFYSVETDTFLITPDLVVGASSGFSDRVWIEAAIAMELAGTGLDDFIVVYDPREPAVIAMERDRAIDQEIETAILNSDLVATGREISVVDDVETDWSWVRLGAGLAGRADMAIDELVDSSGRITELWLIERAGEIIGRISGQVRLTLPISQEAALNRTFAKALFPVLEHHRIPPSRIVFELSEESVFDPGGRARQLVHQLNAIGSSVVLSESDGGWATWAMVRELPVAYIKPKHELVEQAASGDALAIRTLALMAGNASDCDVELIAPHSGLEATTMQELGLSFAEGDRTRFGDLFLTDALQ